MDNGANEGVDIEDHELVLMAVEGNCAEVVAPDHPRDGLVSTNRTLGFSAQYRQLLRDRGVRIMGAPQGGTLKTWLENFHLIRDQVDTIGVSKVCERIPGITSRFQLVAMIAQYGHPIHLLGADNRPSDIGNYTQFANVRGVDTQKPVSGGVHLKRFVMGETKPKSINLDEAAVMDEEQDRIAVDNIRTYREWAKDVD